MKTIWWTITLVLTTCAPSLAQPVVVVNPAQTKLQWQADTAAPPNAAVSYELSAVKSGTTANYLPVTNATRTGEVWQMPFPATLPQGTYLFLLRGVNPFGKGLAAELSITIGGTAPGIPGGFTVIVIGTPLKPE
jgi:hypothetical protein